MAERSDDGEALRRLCGDTRIIEVLIERASREGGQRLPRGHRSTRLGETMDALLESSDAPITREALLDTLRQGHFTQRELWAAPEALRIAIVKGYARAAKPIVQRTPGDQAADCLRLDNLSRTRRMLDGLDWLECFEALSVVDAALRRDPAGTYPRMDDASRQAVRDQVEIIAKHAGLTELAVARRAVAAAREAMGNHTDSDDAMPRATVCWWLYDDEGRSALRAALAKPRLRMPRMVPDPRSRRTMSAIAALAIALFAAMAHLLRTPLLLPACLPIAWTAATAIVGRLFPRFARPAQLLKLKLDRLPDELRTLIVTPVLIPDAAHADEMCDNLESLGALEDDPNLCCLLLGDFADADAEHMPEDEEILRRVRARIAAMNARAGREKYYYLHRPRTLLKADGRWMGRDRKRGALEDLNRLLAGGASAFTAEGTAADALRNRFACVVTLDADTRMLPGTAHRLVGTLYHPLNRRYAVLQPRMEVAPSACANRFARLFSGAGGLDTYPTSVSSLWMDMTGAGVYGGKGVYDVAKFRRALDGTLPEGRILSHDLIEGALAGAGFLGDIALFDGCPATLNGWLSRLHRWTRGDWQLLPMLFSKAQLSPADRFRMLDNLVRSLLAPAQLTLLLWAAWTGDADALLAGLLSIGLNALLHPLTPGAWQRAFADLAALPVTACTLMDAALRALWRTFVSGQRLLDWVPSADAEHGNSSRPIHRLIALLALPGLFVPGATLPSLSIALLFWVGADWVRDMELIPAVAVPPLNESQRAMLRDLARDTWRFFEAMDAALPPDNVQLDPPVPPARRTSPTNIGLYLLSCAATCELGIIDRDTCLSRIGRALDAIDHMEKWRGHLFNWVDIDTLRPLTPRYVSSVDSGNLAACALACANLISDERLSPRLRALAEGMDFTALYDEKHRLFRIGIDVESGVPGASHYDLLASEARILSFTAILLGQAPIEHWSRLGRACMPVGREAALLSWSGTMFEYLMPELLMRAPALSLLGGSNRAAVRAQMAAGTPWGVSESGYHAFDAGMNYQYRAFGLKSLALSGEAVGGVVAPYASALALAILSGDAADNLERMTALGWRGKSGFYEAADSLRPNPDGMPALVMSHMAHHQGMTLCAVCNALMDDRLVRAFMKDPRARAVSLLLEERPATLSRLRPPKKPEPLPRESAQIPARNAKPLDPHLLAGREAHALATPDGTVHYSRGGFDATRFGDALLSRPDAARLYVRVDGIAQGLDWRAAYDTGTARYAADCGSLRVRMTLALSPEDDVLCRAITLRNAGDTSVRVDLMDVVPVALARPEDMRAHAAFQRLFVESSRLDENGVLFTRRSRNPGEVCLVLVHRATGYDHLTFETDSDRLAPRGAAPSFDLTDTLGAVLDPVSALCATITIAPGETRQVCFALKLLPDGEAMPDDPGPERAARLSRARNDQLLAALGISAAEYHRLDRLSALLVDPHLAGQAKAPFTPCGGMSREALWALGLSGDRPMLTLRLTDPGHLPDARALLRAHAFYAAMGIQADLVFIDACPGGYDRPGRSRLSALIDGSPLRGREGVPGGVWILSDLSDDALDTLRRASAIALESGPRFGTQLRRLLEALEAEPPETPLDPGPSRLTPIERAMFNSWGGFMTDGSYCIDVRPESPTPAPWCNILAHESMGLLLTERGGGFLWHDNSRSGRLTAFSGDMPWLTLKLCRAQTGEALSLLPMDSPVAFRVRYAPDEARYACETDLLACETTFHLAGDGVLIDLHLDNRRLKGPGWAVCARVHWLMGTDARDAAWLRTWHAEGGCFASGTMPGVGFLACNHVEATAGDGLRLPLFPDKNHLRFLVGWAADPAEALHRIRNFQEGRVPEIHREHDNCLTFETPDFALNALLNRWLPLQVRASRLYGRTGFYQPGGAYGFRDQLQDVLALLPTAPEVAREHLLRCAGRQFAAGDVLHWWHMPYLGVRTRITDDRLFLPWVAAAYVRRTGDNSILEEVIPYLSDVPIPEGKEDIFQPMAPGDDTGTLHDHCMRAFRSIKTGPHGLALMGAGDWNDGMNRVGAEGIGESIWLSEFLAACAETYVEICPDPDDAEWLRALARRHRGAIELYGWDGGWYRRAYADDGSALGSTENDACRIDLIAQAWAVLADLAPDRCRAAIDAAWDLLVNERYSLIKLLDPPFGSDGFDPGYIRGYPGGVRENGGQYTHAACWLLLALVKLGDVSRAHAALRMLLPSNHADTPERASRYRVEPYVTAADIYTLQGHEGQGGWTWYTGSAVWLYIAALALLGFERRGDRVRLNALLGDWPSVSVTLRHGGSAYHLICAKEVERVTLDGVPVGEDFISMIDDGNDHKATFPPRR